MTDCGVVYLSNLFSYFFKSFAFRCNFSAISRVVLTQVRGISSRSICSTVAHTYTGGIEACVHSSTTCYPIRVDKY